jgi:hypothetical protein
MLKNLAFGAILQANRDDFTTPYHAHEIVVQNGPWYRLSQMPKILRHSGTSEFSSWFMKF